MRHCGAVKFRIPGLAFTAALLVSAIVFGALTSDRAGAYFSGPSGSKAIEKLQVGGTGPEFESPLGIITERDGTLMVVDSVLNAVIRVDPISGDRAIISGPSVGTGPGFINPMGIGVDADDSLLVVDEGLRAVLRVDPETGDRAIISTSLAPDGGSIGSGPAFLSPVGIAFETSDRPLIPDPALGILVVDAALGVIRVDPETGNRDIVSGAGVGSGPAFIRPRGIAVELGADIVVTDVGLDAVVWMDPENGDRTILSR
jgi:streptogramin lyase